MKRSTTPNIKKFCELKFRIPTTKVKPRKQKKIFTVNISTTVRGSDFDFKVTLSNLILDLFKLFYMSEHLKKETMFFVF